MPFNLAQTFFIDPSIVQNAAEISLTAIDLYFKGKPRAVNNKSTIKNPGVEIYIVNTVNSIPVIDDILKSHYSMGRVEYANIRATTDASEATKFTLKRPFKVKTNKEYAIVVKYDGNENFVLWTSKKGDLLVGTTKVSPGPSGKYIGNYYTAISRPYFKPASPPSNSNNIVAMTDSNVGANTADPWNGYGIGVSPADPSSAWKPVSDVDLKFKVYCARYFDNGGIVPSSVSNAPVSTGGVSTGSGSYIFSLAPISYEYILYDRKLSKKTGVKGGERTYQRTVYYPGGYSNSAGASQSLSISVTDGSDLITANAYLPNGQLFNWSSIIKQVNDEFIVVDGTDYATAPKRRTNVRKVLSIESNTVIRVDDTFDFSNNAAKFFISPVATVDFRDKSKSFGKQTDLLVLEDSNANLTHRFVNNTIETITVKTGGTGYSNSDKLTINGYENFGYEVLGGYPALANIVTYANGTINQVYLSNLGCGFVNTAWLKGANIAFSNSTGGSSAGSGATFNYSVGATLGTEYHGTDGLGGFYKGCKVINLEIGQITPELEIANPSGTTYTMKHQILYYAVKSSNTTLGTTYYVNEDANKNRKLVKAFQKHNLPFDNTPVMPSRSNQFVITNGVSATPNSSSGGSNTTIEFSSNNDFVCVDIPPTSHATTYSKYIINNDYTNENTDQGEAFAKHITKKINFANNKFAEDLVVFMTAYRPANTDIKVFARIHNSNDPEAFDDKDWTMLEQTDGIDLYSNPDNESDFIELTYGFQAAPNTVLRFDGSATVTDIANSTILGSGANYTSSAFSLQVGDLVKISQPLFPDSYVVRVVDSVVNSTSFVITKPVANDDLVGSGLAIDFVGRVGNSSLSDVGYPLQAFNNITNDNVVRYYNSSMVEFDTFNTMQLKIVLLSDATTNGAINIYPKVDDIRAVGVST